MKNKASFKFLIIYFLFSFFFFAFFASGMIDSQDGFQYVLIARRLYYDHTLEMPDELFPHKNVHMSLAAGKDGKLYSPTGLGYSLAFLPAVFMEDIFLKLAHQSPLTAFPLHSDWPVLLFASMTNAAFAALLAVTLYLCLKSYRFSHQQALFLSFIGIITSNLWPYSKHVYPHMMFLSFLFLSFYLLRKFLLTQNRKFLFFSGLSYGVVIITYNPTFILPALPLALYYLFYFFKKHRKYLVKINSQKISKLIKKFFLDVRSGLLGVIPLAVFYFLVNKIIFGTTTTSGYGELSIPESLKTSMVFEAVWGILLSPGRSIFIYSPLLLLLILFWFKLKKKLWPELISFGLLSAIYIYFYSALAGTKNFSVWHGEMSWGNRYMMVLLPFLFILVAHVFKNLTKLEKIVVFLPLAILGFYINFLGIIFPYQVKMAALPHNAWIGEKQKNIATLNFGEYPNFIPRYSAPFMMTRTLVQRLKKIKQLYNYGDYNLRLFDGFDAPFDLGWTVWRESLPLARASFDNNPQKAIDSISLQFKNHIVSPASKYPVEISFILNNQELDNKNVLLKPEEEKEIKLNFDQNLIKAKNNVLEVHSHFIGSKTPTLPKKQIIFLQILRFNGLAQNLSTMNFPYVSPVSESLFNINYGYWGKQNLDPWASWQVHSRVFEQTFDFWWLRPFHYWDMPKDFFLSLLTINIIGIWYYGRQVMKYNNV